MWKTYTRNVPWISYDHKIGQSLSPGGEVVFSYIFYSEMLSGTQWAVCKRTIHAEVYIHFLVLSKTLCYLTCLVSKIAVNFG
jgi:hypothetical protein